MYSPHRIVGAVYKTVGEVAEPITDNAHEGIRETTRAALAQHGIVASVCGLQLTVGGCTMARGGVLLVVFRGCVGGLGRWVGQVGRRPGGRWLTHPP